MTLRYEGLRGFCLRVRSIVKNLNREMAKSFRREIFQHNKFKCQAVQTNYDREISVIIPTKNGGQDFLKLLISLREQKNFGKLEIIVVDSGSQDGTPELAETFSAKVYRINPLKFNHGLTRNFGAEKACGEFIIFTVQDAVPLNREWLQSIIMMLEHDSAIAALTCKQFVKRDADLFAHFMNYRQYDSLRLINDEVRYVRNKNEYYSLSPNDKRRISQLDNVCTCFRKEVFDRYKFYEVKYAEDLEIGSRLAMDGHKLAFLTSNGVIHSHNRSSIHFLKRGYIDRRLTPKFLQYEPTEPILPKGLTLQDIFSDMNELYHQVKRTLQKSDSPEYIEKVLRYCSRRPISNKRISNEEKEYTDVEMENFLEEFRISIDMDGEHPSRVGPNIFENGFILIMKHFFKYIKRHWAGEEKGIKLGPSMFKLLGLWYGSYLGDIMNFAEKRGNKLIYQEHIDKLLTTGL